MMNPTLAELILDTKDRNEYSYESLAKACGGVPGAGRLHQLATKEQKTFPDPETINGLARGCKVAPLEVIKAAARSLGLSVSDGAADTVHIHGYDLLPGKLKSTIQDLGEQVSELARKAGDGSEHSATSMNDAEGNSATDNVRNLRETPVYTDPPPASETAAKHGPNIGRSMKQAQDEDAERPDPDPNED